MPQLLVVGGKILGWISTTKLIKYRPAASLITVADDGFDGSSLDQTVLMKPILAM